MKLMTKELKERFEMVGSQEDIKDPLVIAKYFNPTGAGTWYATEYNPKERLFFGYVFISNFHLRQIIIEEPVFCKCSILLCEHKELKLFIPLNSCRARTVKSPH